MKLIEAGDTQTQVSTNDACAGDALVLHFPADDVPSFDPGDAKALHSEMTSPPVHRQPRCPLLGSTRTPGPSSQHLPAIPVASSQEQLVLHLGTLVRSFLPLLQVLRLFPCPSRWELGGDGNPRRLGSVRDDYVTPIRFLPIEAVRHTCSIEVQASSTARPDTLARPSRRRECAALGDMSAAPVHFKFSTTHRTSGRPPAGNGQIEAPGRGPAVLAVTQMIMTQIITVRADRT